MAKIINKRKVMAIARKAIYNFTSDAKPIDAFLDRDRDLNILLADPSKHLFINWDELDEILDKTTTDKTKCYLVSSTRTRNGNVIQTLAIVVPEHYIPRISSLMDRQEVSHVKSLVKGFSVGRRRTAESKLSIIIDYSSRPLPGGDVRKVFIEKYKN